MTRVLTAGFLFCGLLSAYLPSSEATYPYYGTKIGPLSQYHHGVSGDVYAVDSRTLFIRNFNYDGEAPSAYFYVGNTAKPSNDGAYRLRDERGSSTPLTKRYRNKDITLSLPEGKTLRDIKWFSVWCDDFSVNFGDVKIPPSLDFPRPQKISPLKGVHGVSSDNIVIVDAQTLLVPNFSYDGEAPDAKFWVGRGSKPSPQGLRIPDENGKEVPLRRYDRKTIVLTLPGDLTVFDIGHFGVWCEAFTVDFGHIRIPDGLNVPPSLKMLGISPQSKLNCEVLYDDLAFEVRWAVAGESVVVQLVAKLENGEYMSFGVSPNPERTEMVGADVVVAWVDKETGKGYAHDYYLDAKAQCSGTKGSCPDTRIEENTNSVRLLNAAMVNGYSIVTYQRPLKAMDRLDLPIRVNGSQAIVWAIGPLNQRSEVSFHSQWTKGDQFLNFGRQPTWNCPMPEGDARPSETDNNNSEEYYDRRPDRQPQRRVTTAQPEAERRVSARPARRPVPTPKPANTNGAWEIPPIQCYEPEDGVFYAQLGPTGGKHGYPAITGHVGWGISWYINGLLIPEINVVRGKTYTFVVEGGNDPENSAKYHPFYITDDPIGGYEYKTDEEKAGVRIFAGVHRTRSGKVTPTGVGRICNWTPNQDGPPADDYQSFGAYQRTLTLICDEGEPGVITWTPDKNTPNTVYYHCFTHRYLGWKINVHDSCDIESQGSEIDEMFAEPEDDFEAEASIRHETKILPSENFLLQHEKDLIKNHNMNESPPRISFEINKSAEITKLIADGIRAAEALEESVTKKESTSPEYVSSTTPESISFETIIINNLTTPEIQVPQDHLVVPNSELSTFLRPPQSAPFFRPPKIPLRRPPPPIQYERRPSIRPQRPVIIPQPSVIINHYRKQVPAIIRPFVKEKPFPIQPIASVLLLNQNGELGQGPTKRQNEMLLKPKLKPGSIPVPYVDSTPQENKKNFAVVRNGSGLKTKKPYMRLPVMPEKINHKPVFKKPFEIKEEISPVSLRPAVNTGFQPDSVVVEGGFRPIVRRRNEDESEDVNEEQISRRRDENISSDIDEAMEKDGLFFNIEDQSQPFEPMFIPSPPDSTNATIIRKSVPPPKPLRLTGDLMDMEVEEGDDKMAVAAERLDTYYLPPEMKMRPGVVVPDGAVVTYDGKAVLDMSLVNSAPPRVQATETPRGMSKTEQLVRSTPQFGPFKGEMPPPVPDHLPSDAPQSNLMAPKNGHKVPSPVKEYSNPTSDNVNPISTKLSLLKVKNKRDSASEAEAEEE